MQDERVRLTEQQLQCIIGAFKANFSKEDKLWVFGSRADFNAKGGDIDLYVETTILDYDKVFKAKQKMVIDIWRVIGEQKIDIVVNVLSSKEHLAIYDVATKEGICIYGG